MKYNDESGLFDLRDTPRTQAQIDEMIKDMRERGAACIDESALWKGGKFILAFTLFALLYLVVDAWNNRGVIDGISGYGWVFYMSVMLVLQLWFNRWYAKKRSALVAELNAIIAGYIELLSEATEAQKQAAEQCREEDVMVDVYMQQVMNRGRPLLKGEAILICDVSLWTHTAHCDITGEPRREYV